MKLVEDYEFIYAVIGWHPVDAIDCSDEYLQWIEQLAAHPKVVGIGEQVWTIIGVNHQKMYNNIVPKANSFSTKVEFTNHHS